MRDLPIWILGQQCATEGIVEDSDDILKVKAEPPEENGSTQLFARGGNQARGALTKPGCRRRLEQLIFLPQNFGPGEIFQRVKRIFFSETVSRCLRRDLTLSFQVPRAKIPIAIRPPKESDIPVLLNLDRTDLSRQERKELMD